MMSTGLRPNRSPVFRRSAGSRRTRSCPHRRSTAAGLRSRRAADHRRQRDVDDGPVDADHGEGEAEDGEDPPAADQAVAAVPRRAAQQQCRTRRHRTDALRPVGLPPTRFPDVSEASTVPTRTTAPVSSRSVTVAGGGSPGGQRSHRRRRGGLLPLRNHPLQGGRASRHRHHGRNTESNWNFVETSSSTRPSTHPVPLPHELELPRFRDHGVGRVPGSSSAPSQPRHVEHGAQCARSTRTP